MEVRAVHQNGYQFEFTARQHSFRMDNPGHGSPSEVGPSPKEALLAAVIGCSGMDVVAILGKRKQTYSSFSMRAQAQPRDRHPKTFLQIDVEFEIEGESLNPEYVIEAVSGSMTKYCGVSAMVNAVSPIFYTVIMNKEIVYRGQADFSSPPSKTGGI